MFWILFIICFYTWPQQQSLNWFSTQILGKVHVLAIIMNTWTLGWVLAQGKFVTTGPGYSEFRVSNKLVRLYFLIQFWSVLSDRRGVVLKLPGMEVEGRTCKMFLALSYTSSQARGDNPRLFSFNYKEKRSRPSPLCWPISFWSLGIYAWR